MNEAYAVLERWGQAFNTGDADAVASLYAPGATIWGTLAQYLTTSPADIRTYFFEAARSRLRVELGPHVLSRFPGPAPSLPAITNLRARRTDRNFPQGTVLS
jgi:hypothetical protein